MLETVSYFFNNVLYFFRIFQCAKHTNRAWYSSSVILQIKQFLHSRGIGGVL